MTPQEGVLTSSVAWSGTMPENMIGKELCLGNGHASLARSHASPEVWRSDPRRGSRRSNIARSNRRRIAIAAAKAGRNSDDSASRARDVLNTIGGVEYRLFLYGDTSANALAYVWSPVDATVIDISSNASNPNDVQVTPGMTLHHL